MFLKVKRGMAEFSNPGLILVPQIHEGKSVTFQKLWKILVALTCISPMTDSTEWGQQGEEQEVQDKDKTRENYQKKKNVRGPNKPLALHELIVRIDHF